MSRPVMNVPTIVLAGLLAAIGGRTVALGQIVPDDPIVPGEAMVRVARPAQLEACVAALQAQFPKVAVVDAIPGRETYLIGYGLGPGQTPQSVDALLAGLALDGTILWGELNYEGQTGEGRTDSLWVSQVDLGAETYAEQYAFDLLGLGFAHGQSTGYGVVVAVLDTGVDASHPLLAGSIASGGASFVNESPSTGDLGDGVDNDGDGLVDEMAGHGTFVAGLIRLTAPAARLLPVTVLNSDGIGTSWGIAKGLYHAIDAGVHVVNMSLGSTYHAKAVEEAASEARAKGILVVAAAGNVDLEKPREYPACDSAAFGVAATDRFDVKAPFSNYNDKLDLSAPGHSELVGGSFDVAASVISTVPGGGFAVWKGTSFSTAFVSGAAALVRAQHPDWPSATVPAALIVPTIVEVLSASSVAIDDLNPAYEEQLGAGRLDCAAATALGPPQPPPGDLDFDGTVDAVDLAILIGAWGSCRGACIADLDFDGQVGAADLTILLGAWT